MNIVIDNVNLLNPIEGKMDAIIDSFVEVYGEKYRSKITQNLSNAKCIFAPRELSHMPLSLSINEYYTKKKQELEKKLYAKYTKDKSRCEILTAIKHEDIISIKNGLTYGMDWILLFSHKINPILQYLGVLKSKEDLIEQEMKTLNIREGSKEHQELLKTTKGQEFNKMQLTMLFQNPKIEEKFVNFVTKFSEDFEKSGIESKFNKLEKERIKAVSQVKPLDDEQDKIFEENQIELHNFLLRHMAKIKKMSVEELEKDEEVDTMMWSFHDLLSISEEDRCIYSNLSKYAKEDFVNLFRYLGYEYGEEYEEYVSKLDVRGEVFPDKTIEDFMTLKRAHSANSVMNTEIFANALQTIKETAPEYGTLELVLATYDFIKYSNNDTAAMITPCINRNTKQTSALLLCPWGLTDPDSTIIHELGHIAEMSLVRLSQDKAIIKTGLETVKLPRKGIDFSYAYRDYIAETAELDNQFYDECENEEEIILSDPKRKYEIISEVIHEYLALEVCDKLHSRGIKLTLDDRDELNDSSYAKAFGLIGDFIEEHKQEIIDARMSNEPEAIAKIIGKKNFDKIAKETDEYWKKTANFNKFNNFELELEEVMTKNNWTLDEAIESDYNWSNSSKEFVEHHRNIIKIRKEINKNNRKSPNKNNDDFNQ